MSEEEIKIFDGIIAEFELRAKYNANQRDYEEYSVLVKARELLIDSMERGGKNDKARNNR